MLDMENLIEILREALEEQEWSLVEEVLNTLVEETDNPIDVRSVSPTVLEKIEEAEIPQAESLMARPQEEEDMSPVNETSLLERR